MSRPQPRLTNAQLARELLMCGKSVGTPASGSVRRTVARIEAAASAGLLVGGASLGVAEAAVQSTALGGASVLKSVGSWMVAKWFVSGMAVGIVSGGFAAGAIIVGQGQSVQSGRSVAATSVPSAGAARSSTRELNRILSQEPTITTASGIDVPPSSADVAPATQGANRRAADAVKQHSLPISPELARELSMLDHARAALERGDAAHAVQWLEQHRQQFPNGQLVPESALLRQRAESRETTTGRR